MNMKRLALMLALVLALCLGLSAAAETLGDDTAEVEAAANSEDGTSMDVAKIALRKHADDVIRIFERIDPEPVTGANVMGRMLMLIADLMRDPVIAPFFGYAGRAATAFVATGSAMASTAEDEK